MDILIAILTAFLIEIVKHITKDFWKLVKKCIKKATFTPNVINLRNLIKEEFKNHLEIIISR